jgi:cysteine-S-conjugate beta-lyase
VNGPSALIHHGYRPPAHFNAALPPIHKASTVFFENIAAMRSRSWKNKDGYTYGLHGTPSTFTLEAKMASLEGGQHALLTPSGLASIACVNLALLQSGDEVLIPSNCYGPTLTMAQCELAAWGIAHQIYDPMNLDDLKHKLSPQTKLVWLEAAGSVTLEFPDLEGLSKLCNERSITIALDNTWGAGIAFPAFDYADVTVHALTKYPSGGAHLLMGSVVTQSDRLYQTLKATHMRLGFGVGADDVAEVLQGLNSIYLRYQAQDASTRQLAKFFASIPEIVQVLHPSLHDAPGHKAWEKVCTDASGQTHAAAIVSVIFRPELDSDLVDQFCESLALFKIGYSWAGPISLVMPYDLAEIRPHWPRGIARGHLVRFCIGLEDARDLQADLAQALQSLRAKLP